MTIQLSLHYAITADSYHYRFRKHDDCGYHREERSKETLRGSRQEQTSTAMADVMGSVVSMMDMRDSDSSLLVELERKEAQVRGRPSERRKRV